ncbi:MAG TPA: alpha/beta fold hydrolase [Nocardioides sp.]
MSVRLLVTTVLALLALVAPVPATATDGPTWPTYDQDPPGANDWTCRPSAERPVPVVLVHGTFGDRSSLLERMSATLAHEGYCVFSLDYGNRATGPIEDSAAELATFVDRVREATAAPKVSLVGHSQGGMMPRYYVKFLGGDAYVDDLVGLAASNHGTTRSGRMGTSGEYCRSCEQQAAGSEFLADLNAGDESPGAVSYTNVVTRYDEVVVPATSGHLAADVGVTNVTLQDACPLDVAEHLAIPADGPAIEWTLEALGRPGPADPGFRPTCAP